MAEIGMDHCDAPKWRFFNPHGARPRRDWPICANCGQYLTKQQAEDGTWHVRRHIEDEVARRAAQEGEK